jgi:hypothetical protein
LSGPQGVPGPVGSQGPQGPQGEQGPAGEPAAAVAKVANVALSGGDFTSPIAALQAVSVWCGAPSSTNRCLVKIAPGVYDLGPVPPGFTGALRMEPFVDIEGSGQNATRIVASGSSQLPGYPATVATAHDTELRDLTVENTGGTGNAFAITAQGVYGTGQISNVTAIATDASGNAQAITHQNADTAVIKLRNVTAIATGGTAVGIDIDCSVADIDGAVISAAGSVQTYGLQDNSCTEAVRGRITNVKIVAGGGQFTFGFQGQSRSDVSNLTVSTQGSQLAMGVIVANSSLQMIGSRIVASGPGETYGVYVDGSVNVQIDSATITAATATLKSPNLLATGALHVGATRLAGGPAQTVAVSFVCAGVYDENYAFSASACP